VIASHPGYQSAHHAVEIGEGTPAELHLILQRTGTATLVPEAILAQPKDRTGRPRWRLALGGAMLGVGAAMTIGGAAGVALDNSCAAEPLSPGEPCPRLYDTRVGGGITLGSGLLFLGAGGLLLALPGPRQ
jgi:hypothetical protein